MRAAGNGSIQQCAANLVDWERGTIPMDRVRGLGSHVDRGSSRAVEDDARWVIENYEPRAEIDRLTISRDSLNGDISIDLSVTDKPGE